MADYTILPAEAACDPATVSYSCVTSGRPDGAADMCASAAYDADAKDWTITPASFLAGEYTLTITGTLGDQSDTHDFTVAVAEAAPLTECDTATITWNNFYIRDQFTTNPLLWTINDDEDRKNIFTYLPFEDISTTATIDCGTLVVNFYADNV